MLVFNFLNKNYLFICVFEIICMLLFIWGYWFLIYMVMNFSVYKMVFSKKLQSFV